MKYLHLVLIVTVLCISACSNDGARGRMEVSYSRENIARGRELARGLGACGYCHGESASPDAPLSGGRVQYDMYGPVSAANITPAKSGIAGWSLEDFIRALRNHKNPAGEKIAQDIHRGIEWMSDQDMAALYAYLTSLPARETEVTRRSVSFVDRNTTGFFHGSREVVGYVPPPARGDEIEYGRYLTDQVAHCGACHSSRGGLLSSAGYLKGGDAVKTEIGERVAPAIDAQGAGSWSLDELVSYLRTGQTPDNRISSFDYCPVQFYRNAPEAELRAVAAYLKTSGK